MMANEDNQQDTNSQPDDNFDLMDEKNYQNPRDLEDLEHDVSDADNTQQ